MQGVIIVVQDNITFIQRLPCIIQAGYLEAVMLSGDNEGFQTQGGLPQFFSQRSQLPLLPLTATLQSLNLRDKNET